MFTESMAIFLQTTALQEKTHFIFMFPVFLYSRRNRILDPHVQIKSFLKHTTLEAWRPCSFSSSRVTRVCVYVSSPFSGRREKKSSLRISLSLCLCYATLKKEEEEPACLFKEREKSFFFFHLLHLCEL